MATGGLKINKFMKEDISEVIKYETITDTLPPTFPEHTLTFNVPNGVFYACIKLKGVLTCGGSYENLSLSLDIDKLTLEDFLRITLTKVNESQIELNIKATRNDVTYEGSVELEYFYK